MDRIKNFYKEKTDLVNILFIILLIIIGYLIFHGSFNGILTDKGRELLYPAAIAEGKVLYKDILCIYFPLAFQINAIAYKLLGINVQTLEFINVINAFITCFAIYFITKEFLSKHFALLLSSLTAIGGIFNGTLFNLLLPYSCSFTYGISAYLISILFLIKYIKTNNTKFLPFAYLSAGFAFACKSEFIILFAIILVTTFIIKPCNIQKNILNLISFIIFPIISLSVLFIQGVSFSDLITSFEFMKRFFTTDSMIYHIGKTGTIFRLDNFNLYFQYIPKFIGLYILSYALFKKTKHTPFIVLSAGISAYIANLTNVGMNTLLLPITVLAILLYKAKDIYKDKALFILIISAIALNIRMFWALVLSTYGIHTATILILSFIVLVFKYLPEYKYLSKQDLKQFTTYMLIVYIIFFTAFTIWQKKRNNTPIITDRGTIQIPKKEADVLIFAMDYIKKYSIPEHKILVLPEGLAINFLINRELDYKLPIADRLYYDALGSEKIIESIKKTDYEMIIIAKGHGLTNFGKPYLYNENNEVIKYLEENYKLDWETKFVEKNLENTLKCYVKPY